MASTPRITLHGSSKEVLGKTEVVTHSKQGATHTKGKRAQRKERHRAVSNLKTSLLEQLAYFYEDLKQRRKNVTQEELENEYFAFVKQLAVAAQKFQPKKTSTATQNKMEPSRDASQNTKARHELVTLVETPASADSSVVLNQRPDLNYEDNNWLTPESVRALRSFHPEVVLYAPQIPPNTGTVARLCAAFSAKLSLIEPLGFVISDKALRRAGLDYWDELDVHLHKDWQTFVASKGDRRLIFIETGDGQTPEEFQFQPGDCLVFGAETFGVPKHIMQPLLETKQADLITIPMYHRGVRSINLANTVAIVLRAAIAALHGKK